MFGVVCAHACFFSAVNYLPIGIALLLEDLGLLLVVGWMWARHGQRPRRYAIAGSIAAVIGLILVLDPTAEGASLHPIGVLWGLGAAVGLASYFVISARSDPALPPVVLASGGMVVGTVALGLLGVVGALPMRATFGEVDFAGHSVSWLVPVIGVSLVAAVVSYLTGIGAARALGARLASFVGLTEVIFAVLIAWLTFNELPAGVQLVGGAFIVTGAALVRLDEWRQPPPQTPQPRDEPAPSEEVQVDGEPAAAPAG